MQRSFFACLEKRALTNENHTYSAARRARPGPLRRRSGPLGRVCCPSLDLGRPISTLLRHTCDPPSASKRMPTRRAAEPHQFVAGNRGRASTSTSWSTEACQSTSSSTKWPTSSSDSGSPGRTTTDCHLGQLLRIFKSLFVRAARCAAGARRQAPRRRRPGGCRAGRRPPCFTRVPPARLATLTAACAPEAPSLPP